MSRRAWLVVAVAVVAAGLLGTGLATGVHCAGGCAPGAGPVTIDAGPLEREIERKRTDAVVDRERKLEIVEDAHRERIDAMTEAERAEFERVRALPPEELERWLEQFDSSLRSPSSP